MSELLHNPRPPEVDPARLEERIELLRLKPPRLSAAVYAGARDPGREDARGRERDRERGRQEVAELARLSRDS
jgi:hypothetical protein